jgi:hypothetical protein
MDGSSLLEGKNLIAVRLGMEKGSHLVEQAAEAHSSDAVFEPAHRPIPFFDPSMILLRMVIQVAIGPMFYLEPIPIGSISGILWGKTSLPEELEP